MRLIDADKLRDKFISIVDTSIWCAFCNEVNNAPTVDLSEHDSELLDRVAEKIREHSGLHYVDCDGYFGGIAELIFKVEIFKVDDWLDDIIAELKAEVEKNG